MARHGGFPGMGMGNMQQLQRQMQKLQQQMADTQEQLEARSYEATSGGGMVTATVSGKKQLVSLTVKPEAVDPEDVEMLQDLILTAVNGAIKLADDETSKAMAKLQGGLGGFPGLF